MKKLSETYKERGIAFTFPIEIKDENGNETYCEDSNGYWYCAEYNENGNATYYENSEDFWYLREYGESGHETYFEDSDGFWYRVEYDEKGNQTYFENSDGYKEGTKKGSCAGKVIEIDGKKYKLTEL